MAIIKPVKPHKNIIDPKECVGCMYRTSKNKQTTCKSCGNWKL